jgi:hypothetical protein
MKRACIAPNKESGATRQSHKLLERRCNGHSLAATRSFNYLLRKCLFARSECYKAGKFKLFPEPIDNSRKTHRRPEFGSPTTPRIDYSEPGVLVRFKQVFDISLIRWGNRYWKLIPSLCMRPYGSDKFQILFYHVSARIYDNLVCKEESAARLAQAIIRKAYSSPATRACGNSGRLKESLKIEDNINGASSQFANSRKSITPGSSIERRAPPAPGVDLYYLINCRITFEYRGRGAFYNPTDAAFRIGMAQRRDRRQSVDDVAYRTEFYNKEFQKSSPVTPVICD